ncbi:MAG: response regulator [Chloroflexi bacterium]|nr:response regulator [Chloroflexota bacterium]
MKILVVDDEPHIRHMLRFLFEKRGHDVITVEDGRLACDAVASDPPDIVFLDLNLPSMSGFEVCEEIREQVGHRSLPIYILTAQGQDIDRERGLALGATDYITKPFSPSHLAEIVEALDDRSSTPQR